MRYFWFTVGLLAAGAAAVGFLGYRLSLDSALEAESQRSDTMAWLRTEFHLNAAQFSEITRLHETYSSVCAGHCRSIMEARLRNAPPAEIKGLEDACVRSMTDHFRHVAAVMPPGEGNRYLALVLPRIGAYPHTGAPTLRGTP